MKNTFKYILPLFLLSGCGDDFLDLTPHSSANVEDFYNTPADIEVAVNGVYRTLQMAGQYGQSIYTIGDVASDNCIAGRPLDPWQDIAMHRIPSTNGVVENSWNHNYQGIQAVNTILNRVDEVEFADQSIKNRLVGEVKFLRALMYFNLVRIYGAVPLVLSETRSPEEGYTQGRDPETEVYEQIMRDLSEAASEGSLPVEYSSSDIGRATRGAALALMGKVHMTLSNYSEAANYLRQVIDLGVYRLLDEYADIFEISNANHAESIFEVQYKSGTGQGLGSGYFHTFSPFTAGSLIVGVGGGAGLAQPTAELMAAYEEGDLRREVSLQEGFVNEEGEFIPEPWISKYIDPAPFQPSDNNNNWIVMRYADILLMYAEALNEQTFEAGGEALIYLNMVRERAGLEGYTPGQLSNQDDFRLALENERRFELAFEGHRWFDLVRTNRLLPIMNSKGFELQEYQKIFPIPQTQIDVNPGVITQNPGHTL